MNYRENRRKLYAAVRRLPLLILEHGADIIALPREKLEAALSNNAAVSDELSSGTSSVLTAPSWCSQLQDWFERTCVGNAVDFGLIGRKDVAEAVIARICVHQAAKAASQAAAPAQVIAALWPDSDCGMRFVVATQGERHIIGSVLWDHVVKFIQTAPVEKQIILGRYGDVLSKFSAEDPAYDRKNFNVLARNGIELIAQVAEMLSFVEEFDPHWYRSSLLPMMHPAVGFAWMTMFFDDTDRLISMLENPAEHIIAIAIFHLSRAFQGTFAFQQEAMEVRDGLEHRRPGAEEAFAELRSRVVQSLNDIRSRQKRMEEILQPRAASLAKLLFAAALDKHDCELLRETLVHLLAALPPMQLRYLADEQIELAKSSGQWSGCMLMVEVAEKTEKNDIIKKAALACSAYYLENPLGNRPESRGVDHELIIMGLVQEGVGDRDTFMQRLEHAQAQALWQCTGRDTKLKFPAIDEAAMRACAVVRLAAAHVVGYSFELWEQELDWLCRMVAVAPVYPTEWLSSLAHLLLLTASSDSPAQVAAGIRLITAAAQSESFTHAWGGWLPDEPTLRQRLIDGAHAACLHRDAEFVMRTARSKHSDFLNGYSAFLETSCHECQTIALSRVETCLNGPPAEIASELMEVHRGKKALVQPRVEALLSWPLRDSRGRRLRDALLRAVRDLTPEIDLDRLRSRFSWAQEMEELGLGVGSAFWQR